MNRHFLVRALDGRSLSRCPGATSSHTTKTRQVRCVLPMIMSSNFGAEQRISKPLTALAFQTGRHREILKHPRPKIRKCNATKNSQITTDRIRVRPTVNDREIKYSMLRYPVINFIRRASPNTFSFARLGAFSCFPAPRLPAKSRATSCAVHMIRA